MNNDQRIKREKEEMRKRHFKIPSKEHRDWCSKETESVEPIPQDCQIALDRIRGDLSWREFAKEIGNGESITPCPPPANLYLR